MAMLPINLSHSVAHVVRVDGWQYHSKKTVSIAQFGNIVDQMFHVPPTNLGTYIRISGSHQWFTCSAWQLNHWTHTHTFYINTATGFRLFLFFLLTFTWVAMSSKLSWKVQKCLKRMKLRAHKQTTINGEYWNEETSQLKYSNVSIVSFENIWHKQHLTFVPEMVQALPRWLKGNATLIGLINNGCQHQWNVYIYIYRNNYGLQLQLNVWNVVDTIDIFFWLTQLTTSHCFHQYDSIRLCNVMCWCM